MFFKSIFTKTALTIVGFITVLSLMACSSKNDEFELDSKNNLETVENQKVKEILKTGIENESSNDAIIDFKALQEDNSDIYAWINIPNTGIDIAIAQSGVSDDYYTNHNLYGSEDINGAAYTEMFTMRDMCDFNTVIRGSSSVFKNLSDFLNPDFFEKNEKFYIYLDGNVLTYEIVACYTTDGDSPVREYEFYTVEGCRKYINDVFNTRDMNKQIRADWSGLNEYNFLTSVYVDTPSDSGKHIVLLGALIGDAAGTINRVVVENSDDIDISALLSLMENAE